MTEKEWLELEDPGALGKAFNFSKGFVLGGLPPPSDRKLRLFVVGCCRQIWHLLPDARSRLVVEVAEQYADGEVTPRELGIACRVAHGAAEDAVGNLAKNGAWAAAWAAGASVLDAVSAAARAATNTAARAIAPDIPFAQSAAWTAACKGQADLLREILGNPFRPMTAPPVPRAVLGMAQYAYDSRDFAGLPAAADAMEEAGCTDRELLLHLRGHRLVDDRTWATEPLSHPHVRGCWALDLLLGRK